MSNKRAIFAFVLGVCAVLAAMAWVTSHTLRLERAEVEARAEAHRQEVVRLVLWRMDSALTPIIAREAARPYFEYQAFYSAAPTINTSVNAQNGSDVLVPSPLISPSEQFVHLYFQNVLGGEITSPQVPTGVYENLAELSYVTSYSIAAARERLNTLSQLIAKHPYPKQLLDRSGTEVELGNVMGIGEKPGLVAAVTTDSLGNRFQIKDDHARGLSDSLDGDKDAAESKLEAMSADTPGAPSSTTQIPQRVGGRAASVGSPTALLGQPSGEAASTSSEVASPLPQSSSVPPTTSSAGPVRDVLPQTSQTSPATQQTISEYQARQMATSAANTLTENRSKSQLPSRQRVATPQVDDPLSSVSSEASSAVGIPVESTFPHTVIDSDAGLKKETDQGEPTYSLFASISNSGITRWQSTWRNDHTEPLSLHDLTESVILRSFVASDGSTKSLREQIKPGDLQSSKVDSSNVLSSSASTATPKPLAPPSSPLLAIPHSDTSPVSAGPTLTTPHALQPRIGSQAPTFMQSPFVARWIEPSPGASPELLFERVVQITPATDSLTPAQVAQPQPTTTYIQGIWLDWPSLKSLLLSTSVDLLPTAELTPVYDMTIIEGDQSLLGRLLASIPAQLVLPPVTEVTLAGWTPIRTTLGVMWSVVLVAICIAAIVLAASIDLAQRRGRFVSAVTHELRTPITTFCMYSQMLADGMVPDGEAKQGYFQTLKGESQRLARIVESVLDYARLSGKKAPVYNTSLSIAQLLADLVPQLTARCDISEMKLIVIAPEHEAPALQRFITTDRERVDRILFNLIENACKYASESDSRVVQLEVSILPRALELSVIDHGPGIDSREARRIFKPFTRGDSHAHGTIPGLGLGLAISQGLAHELGGTLELAPKRIKEGARFVLTLPLS